jgi:hypothetical protein
MKNGHLPSHIAWIAYKHQLWPGLRYGLGTMTNDLEVANKLLNKTDYKMLNILGFFASSPPDCGNSTPLLVYLDCSAFPPSNSSAVST